MKNKKLFMKIIFPIIAILLGGAAIGLCAATFVKFSYTLIGETISETASGFDVMFGLDGSEIAVVSLLAFIFTCVAILSLGVSLFLKKRAKKLVKLVAVLFFIAGGVLFFFSKMNFLTANGVDSMTEHFYLGWGAIVAGIVAILAGLITACDTCKWGKTKK